MDFRGGIDFFLVIGHQVEVGKSIASLEGFEVSDCEL